MSAALSRKPSSSACVSLLAGRLRRVFILAIGTCILCNGSSIRPPRGRLCKSPRTLPDDAAFAGEPESLMGGPRLLSPTGPGPDGKCNRQRYLAPSRQNYL